MAIDTTIPRTRRAILIGALGGVAAAAASTVGRASPVSATDGDPLLVGHTYSSTTRTKIDATGSVALWGTSDTAAAIHGKSDSGNGVDATSNSGNGIDARSTSGIAVVGTSHGKNQPAILGQANGRGAGVYGWSASGPAPLPTSGAGVFGYTTLPNGQGVLGTNTHGVGVFGFSGPVWGANGYGIQGHAEGRRARGVFGEATAKSGTTYGVYGQSDSVNGTGVQGRTTAMSGKTQGVCGQIESPVGVGAVVGHSHAATGSAPGVLGTTRSPDGVAVVGTGALGRGGLFSGSKAQLRLKPSTTASHPKSGLRGDLFLDQAGRLWLCKGTTTWVQLG
jgi:hypothetical protein